MQWMFVAMMMAMAGCGGDGVAWVDRSEWTPEDYLPSSVDLSGYSEAQTVCALHVAVVVTRHDECERGLGQHGASVEQAVLSCGTDPSTMEQLRAVGIVDCLDVRATAPCSQLEGDTPCAIWPSWDGPDQTSS